MDDQEVKRIIQKGIELEIVRLETIIDQDCGPLCICKVGEFYSFLFTKDCTAKTYMELFGKRLLLKELCDMIKNGEISKSFVFEIEKKIKE